MTRARAGLAAALCVGVVVPVGVAVAAPPVDRVWQPDQRLSETGVQASDPEAVVDAAGRSTAVWATGRSVQVRRRGAGGTLGAVKDLGRGDNPTVAASGNGTVTVVWEGVRGSLKVTRKQPAKAWGPVQTLSPPYPKGTHIGLAKGAIEPRLAVNAGGATVVVWEYGYLNDMPDTGGRLRAAYRAPGQGWSVDNLTTYALGGKDHEVAIHEDGDVEVVFETTAVHAIHRTLGVGWSPVVRLDRRGYNPTVAADDEGNATAGWVRRRQGADDTIYVAERPSGGPWAGATQFPSTLSGYDFTLRMDDQSRTLAAWIGLDAQSVRVAGRDFGAPFWTPASTVASVSGDNTYLDALRLVTNPRGDALLTWIGSTDPGAALEFAVYAVTRPWDSGTWTPASRVTTRYPAQVADHAAALGPTGVGAAVWDRGRPSPRIVEGRWWTP